MSSCTFLGRLDMVNRWIKLEVILRSIVVNMKKTVDFDFCKVVATSLSKKRDKKKRVLVSIISFKLKEVSEEGLGWFCTSKSSHLAFLRATSALAKATSFSALRNFRTAVSQYFLDVGKCLEIWIIIVSTQYTSYLEGLDIFQRKTKKGGAGFSCGRPNFFIPL